ncbi:MAG: hypothetical protein NVSMB18_29580 [Acetobacteraceae bacterium]
MDGYSHIPGFLLDAFEGENFATVEGSYQYHAMIRDHAGNGFDIDASFEVIPEPSSAGLLLGVVMTVFALHRCRPIKVARHRK